MNRKQYVNKIQYVIALWVAVAGVVLLGALWGYGWGKSSLEKSAISAYEKEVSSDIKALIEDKRDASMAIAITLSENPDIKTMLCKTCAPINFDFKQLSDQLTVNTNFNNVWLQLIDSEGVSLLRSWTPKKGDSLLKVRQDIRDNLANPKVTRTLSVGKFSLSVKSAVPIFDEQKKILGLVEVISKFGTLEKRLKQDKDIDSVILADKRFRKQLTNAETGLFIEDYYVVNKTSLVQNRTFLSELAKTDFTHFGNYQLHGQTIIGRHLIQDNNSQEVASWFTFSKKSKVNFTEMEQILAGYIYAVMLFLLLLTVLFIVYYFKRQSDGRRHYYRQIIDSASDIILVADRNKVVDANQHFFDFYSDFSTLTEFLEKHVDLSHTFEKEEGFLQEYMQGTYWLDYVLQDRKKIHKAKIMKEGQPHYFSVKAGMMEGLEKPLFNVLLQEITEQELYKNQLEHLSQTDALTGIGNRLYFNRSLNKEIQRSHRYKSDLSLLMFDIDFFKKVNDNYGHDVGDQVLVEISAVMQSLLRETDIFCRFGGEEFAIIMPETGLVEAENSAERLRATIEEISTDEFPSKLTISFGVGQVTKWDNETTILKRVDTALYSAKELGRNRVVVAEGNGIERS